MIATTTAPTITLRPYQQEALDGIYSQLDEHDSTLLVMATGVGKTIVFSHAV
ncbi:MAG: DEAD/DEAH box helicase family protein, partial [Methanobacteriota archaeon]